MFARACLMRALRTFPMKCFLIVTLGFVCKNSGFEFYRNVPANKPETGESKPVGQDLNFSRSARFQITNQEKFPLAYKFQSNRAEAYCMLPSTGILESGNTLAVTTYIRKGFHQQPGDKFRILALPLGDSKMRKEQVETLWRLVQKASTLNSVNNKPASDISYLDEQDLTDDDPRLIKWIRPIGYRQLIILKLALLLILALTTFTVVLPHWHRTYISGSSWSLPWFSGSQRKSFLGTFWLDFLHILY